MLEVVCEMGRSKSELRGLEEPVGLSCQPAWSSLLRQLENLQDSVSHTSVAWEMKYQGLSNDDMERRDPEAIGGVSTLEITAVGISPWGAPSFSQGSEALTRCMMPGSEKFI